ncbi:SLC13 family permease [Papillibacter cinnamivorans]|uniref:Anion transporter n=1 Tax=Papillibacter cinnamivorans DSM 12816 TaxID=1122930 RepID=A0A1W1ZHG3_9FIRM|nr:SLC13 family permease [Papillibacter cinnamivorans]SMC47488.1 anion transporter [Papillibacter cinnamivorans DSM 12816]
MNKKVVWIGFSLLLLLGLYIGIALPFTPALDPLGNRVLMMLLITVGIWIFKPLGISQATGGCLFAASLLIMGVAPAKIFSGFTSTAVWTLIPALFFGFVLAKTGLGRRIAYLGMKYARLTYPGILFIWVVIGVVLSLLTPSITVRVVIITPIAMNCVDLCHLEEKSRGRSLVLLTAWAMALIPGTGWLTGSLNGPILSGLYAGVPELGPIDSAAWLSVAMLPAALISVLVVVGGYIVLRPADRLNIQKDAFLLEYKKLGPMSRDEKITMLILVGACLFFATSSLHKIPDAAVCLVAFFLLVVLGVIRPQEINTGINWDLMIFYGVAMSLSAVFQAAGVSAWLSDLLVPLFAPISGSPWLFILALMPILFLLRFIDIALFVPSLAVLVPILPQVFQVYGVHPLVWIPLFNIAINACFMSYQNVFALIAESNMQGRGWVPSHFTRFGVVYFVSSMLALLVAIPYWISMGLFS